MKKSLLLILASLFAIFALAGCAEDSKNDNGGTTPTPTPTPTPSPLPDINTLKGTYNIDFFYTDGGKVAVVTTDCSKITEYVGSTAKPCADAAKENVDYTGKLTFDVLTDGSVKIISKIQMAGGAFENTDMGKTAKSQGANYNYTEYAVIPKEAISATKINDPATGKNVKGVQGRNAVSITPYDSSSTIQMNNAAHTTYEFTYENGVLICKMRDTSSLVAADVVIRLKKTADTIEAFDANTPFDTPVIDNFVNFYNDIIGSYTIDSLNNNPGSATDYARINSNNNHLSLDLNLINGALRVFVYSEDPATLMANGFTHGVDAEGNTTVNFNLPGMAEINMTRNTPYNTAQGIGEKQANISLNINGGKNITADTKSFNVIITQPSNTGNNAYNISVYNNIQSLLPAGSYVGVGTPNNTNFSSNTTNCTSKAGVTTCSVSVTGLTAGTTETPYIVVVEEVDSTNTPTGVKALGLVKLSAATPAQ